MVIEREGSQGRDSEINSEWIRGEGRKERAMGGERGREKKGERRRKGLKRRE